MEWLVRRMFLSGRAQTVAMRNAKEVRGRLSVGQEDDKARGRYILVARLAVGSEFDRLPPLHDVTLVSANGSQMVLTGHERIEAGPMHEEHYLVQTWVACPATDEDLRKATQEWQRMAETIELLRAAGVAIPHVP